MGTVFLIVSNIWLYLFCVFPPTAGVFGEKPPEITATPGSFLGKKSSYQSGKTIESLSSHSLILTQACYHTLISMETY